jgi:polar amino acid transport system permease protein
MFDALQQHMPFLLQGLWMTVRVTLLGICFGTLLGALVGIARALGPRPLFWLLGAYIHLWRGTPFLCQIYIVYFVLPQTGAAWLQFDSFQASVVALTIYSSSYIAEIVRAAINAVPRGQVEGARSVGMTSSQTLRYVIAPQALRMVLPPLGGVYVIMVKVTAVLSVIGTTELVRQANLVIQRDPANIMPIFLVVAALYFVFCYPLLRLTQWAERRYGGLHLEA